MKSLTTSLCILALALSSTTSSPGQEKPSVAAKVADAALVRPISFASTVVGGALFVLSLPVTAPLKKTKPVAHALVIHPARATFQRPLGDMDALAD